MSYQALARKWRPRTFAELLGQEHINKSLINALNQQRLHHAYLFTGTRGVGKTSVARILAKSLNCEQGISSQPCLSCSACTAIEQGRFIDLIEIDGASKTRVEDTRDMLDNVQYAPTSGRFKIYLIDEVHMLSQHSFNALLKTLEEPPAHVKFILATTDPQKLPVTVLSRCLQFNLKHLTAELISKHLQSILQEEQLDFEPEALNILAHAAQGSMRDALSLLDQAITSCDRKLLSGEVKTLLGYTQQDYAMQILQALSVYNATQLLTISQQISIEGGHFLYVLNELLQHLHQICIYQNIGDNSPLISPSSEIKALSQHFSAEDVQLFYQIALKGGEDIHLAPTLAIGFNMTTLRMLTFRPADKVPIAALVSAIPERPPLTQLNSNENSRILPVLHESSQVQEQRPVPKLAEEPQKAEILETSSPKNWADIIPQLKLSGLALNAIENAEFISKEGREVQVRVAKGHLSLFTPNTVARIETALGSFYKESVKITLCSDAVVQTSPAQQKQKATQEKLLQAELALNNDPVLQQVQQEFSAELVKNSIVPL